jgi:hypothetical protein
MTYTFRFNFADIISIDLKVIFFGLPVAYSEHWLALEGLEGLEGLEAVSNYNESLTQEKYFF